jgi:hypothetical protein
MYFATIGQLYLSKPLGEVGSLLQGIGTSIEYLSREDKIIQSIKF